MPHYGVNYEEEYSVDTFDMMVGYVGGFYAMLWAFMYWWMSDYESFKKSQGLISNFYSAENPNDPFSRLDLKGKNVPQDKI